MAAQPLELLSRSGELRGIRSDPRRVESLEIEITVDQANPKCDMIAKGDLAEASVCVRGANPETGTLELANRAGWLMGTEAERKREVEVVKRSMRQLQTSSPR